LITGTTIPNISSQPLQSSTDDISQIVKQISERVTSANPGTTAVFVEQILTELARQSSQVSSQGNVLQDIYSQVLTYPYGIESQSLARFASLLSSDSGILLSIVQKIIQEQASGSSPSQSIVNIAVQDATGGGKNVNDEIALAAQIIAKQVPNIPVRNIESIIIQMALEISRAQGKAITGQTIFEIASQIKQNPSGVLTQAILQLAKQDTHDNGKTGETVKVIRKSFQVTDRTEKSKGSDKALGQPPGIQPPGIQPPGIQPPGIQPPGIQPSPLGLPTIGDLLGGVLGPSLGPFVKEVVNSVYQGAWGPAGPQIAGLAAMGVSELLGDLADYFVLRTANNMEGPQAIQKIKDFQDIQREPNLLQKLSQIAQLYRTGNDVSANQALELISDKIVSGSDPAVAIRETSIPKAEVSFPSVQTIGVTDPLFVVKSLPPSDGNTTGGNGTAIDESSSPEQMGLPGEPAFYPGLGMLASQPDSPMPPSETSLPPEPFLSPVEPSGTGLSQFFPASPSGLGTPADIECLGSLELCTSVVPSPSPVIDICQEQWYLPECTNNGNNLEEDNLQDGDDAQSQAPAYNEGGYQQLPYYYEPEGYQEGEDQYSEDSSNEEDDYEGGYQEYEQDYSEEEDSGDEEDDYEEVGNYQEEEDAYSEEEVEEQDDGGEEEDFTEEKEESVEYYEE
jgi:hypothetical protein